MADKGAQTGYRRRKKSAAKLQLLRQRLAARTLDAFKDRSVAKVRIFATVDSFSQVFAEMKLRIGGAADALSQSVSGSSEGPENYPRRSQRRVVLPTLNGVFQQYPPERT